MKRDNKIISLLIALFFLVPTFTMGISENSNIFSERRDKLRSQIKEGLILIQSSERNQNNLYEFFVPNSDNHDFIFLTGLETPGSTLILCPGSKNYPEILYIDGDLEEIKQKTGINHVYPTENFMSDLSNAYTDYSLLRSTQLRFKPLPSELSRILYTEGRNKIIYFNFPRFVNLEEPPPKRLELINRIQSFSPKYEIRDISDELDKLRMYHDEFGITQLKRAARISGEAMIESMKSVTPGMTAEQLRSVFNFVSYFRGAKNFGFSTSIRSGPSSSTEHFPRNEQILKAGDLVTIDAGVEINFYSADIQRTFPVSGKFSKRQAEIYNILKRTQEICIDLVKPGVTMKQLQMAAIKALDDQGGYGKYFRWGTSHFLGMEVHDHGNNLIPFKPGICITVEPGLVMDEFTIVLEDDVLCTEDGFEWLTQFVPREIEEIEQIMTEDGIGKIYFQRQEKQYTDEFNKLIQLQKEVSGIHSSLQIFYPIALVEDNFFYIYDFDPVKKNYSFVKKEKSGFPISRGIRASFPLNVYDNKPSCVVSDEIFEERDGYAMLFHEFVYCYQTSTVEYELKEDLRQLFDELYGASRNGVRN